MKHLRKFDSVAAMETAVANPEVNFIGLAYDNSEPKINITSVHSAPSHDYVEIGGLKWATKNIGAETETDTGLYFQWGDTQGYTADQVGTGEGKKAFSWADYKFNPSGDGKTFTKYNKTDNKTELDPDDDAAHVIMGGDWRIPTITEWFSLKTNTTSQWVTNYNGSNVNGRLFTDKTDPSKKLFFPASGGCNNGSVYDVGEYSKVWGCSLDERDVRNAYYLLAYSDEAAFYTLNRNDGHVVRGVQTIPA